MEKGNEGEEGAEEEETGNLTGCRDKKMQHLGWDSLNISFRCSYSRVHQFCDK